MHILDKVSLQSQVAAHAAALDALNEPFSSAAWWQCFIGHVAGAQGQYLAVGAPGRAPAWLLERAPRTGELRALSNYYTGLYGPSGAPGTADLQALLDTVALPQLRCPVLHLAPLSQDAGRALRQALQRLGWHARVFPAFGNWTQPVQGLRFPDYMARRPARLLGTWRRKQRRFTQPGGAGAIHWYTRPDEVEPGMTAFESVYARSWKPQESHPGLVREWARQCAARGWLRLAVATWEGRPVAAQFWFTAHGRACIFKLAYDEACKPLSAGTVLTAEMFRHSMEVDGVHEVDYLSGDDAYKQDWMSHRRQRVAVLACNPARVHGLLRMLRAWGSDLRGRLHGRAPWRLPEAGS
jgi:CelD/BcsL family acetyltransferase involved in cellulose biosynthesis